METSRIRRATRLVGAAMVLCAISMLVPVLAFAHPGHEHAATGFDGRMADRPDTFRAGQQVYRYRPGHDDYEVRRQGRPPGYVHLDAPVEIEGATPKAEWANAEGPSVALPSQELAPVCRTEGNRIVVVYTRRTWESGVPASTIRSIVKRMNWKIADQSSQSSAGNRVVKMAVDCSGAGEINVYEVATSPSNDFAKVTEAVAAALGTPFGEEAVKYLIFDSQSNFSASGAGGPIYNDAAKLHWNENAVNTSYALTYKPSWETHVTIHELSHSLGAAQGKVSPKAPLSSPGYHCTDGLDALCYADGTATYFRDYCPESEGYLTPTKVPIDCNKDTYFNAAPGESSWLGEYWNLAGPENSFFVAPPKAATEAASEVKDEGATLHGTITPEGTQSSYYFEYGEQGKEGYEEQTFSTEVGYGESFAFDGTAEAEAAIEGLKPGTAYKFRIVAENTDGALGYGAEKTFTTLGPPSATTQAATSVGSSGATLKGSVNPNGISTTYQFEYGTTTSYGKGIPASPASVGFGTSPVSVSQEVTGLFPNTTYHFRVKATNEKGTTYGKDSSFTTLSTPPIYQTSFGSSGSGNGQLNSPSDAAVDAEGNVWIADRLNNRIQKFNANGEYVSQFGTKGSASGQLNAPAGVTIDSKGNIWVADAGNGRVQKFNSKGEYQLKFGSFGVEDGQFAGNGPKGIAIDAGGNVWVTDYSHRVQKFNESGGFLKAVGTEGENPGQFIESSGIDVANSKVWVGDWINDRINVFTEAGSFLFSLGAEGSTDGKFNHVEGVEVDANGSVWIQDEDNSRIQQFSQGGVFLSKFGSYGSGAGQFKFNWPTSLTSDDKGNLWVADTENHRVQRWIIPGYTPTFQSSFGASGSGNGQLNSPSDTAVDAEGNVWVTDQWNNRVQKFNSKGEYLSQFGTAGSGNGQLSGPAGIAIDSKGNLWVADRWNHRIQKFNSKGEYVAKCGSVGTGDGQFSSWGPKGIAIDAGGNVWVSDYSGRIQKFNEACEFVKAVGSKGSGNGQFGESAGIDVAGGLIWVGDWTNHRVSVFNEAGEFQFKFGSYGSGNGQFNHPDGVEVDVAGSAWILDEGNSRVQKFNQSGGYVGQFGSAGSGAGQFSFGWPVGLTSDDKGNLWISDTKNHRVQRWIYAP